MINNWPLFETPPTPLVTLLLLLQAQSDPCTGTCANGFSDWRPSCPTTNLAIQVTPHPHPISHSCQLLFWDPFANQCGWILSDLSSYPHIIISSCIHTHPHAESLFTSWNPAVPSLGEKQEVFLHEGEVGKFSPKEEEKQTKSAPLWRSNSASRLQPKKCEIKKTILQYYHQPTLPLLSSDPHAILASLLLLIVIWYIWKI